MKTYQVGTYDFWWDALEGKVTHVHEGELHCGYYRKKRHKKGALDCPVAIWMDDARELHCVVNDFPVKFDDAVRMWTYGLHSHPVTEEDYYKLLAGESLDDLDPTVAASLRSNSAGIEDAEMLKDQIESAVIAARGYDSIDTEAALAQAHSVRARLMELRKQAEEIRKREKKEPWELCKRIDATWKPLVEMADEPIDKVTLAMGAYEGRQRRAAAEAQRAEAQKLEQEARRLAAAAEPAPVVPPTPTPSVSQPEPRTQIKSAYGRAASVRAVMQVASVTDWRELWAHYSTDEGVRERLLKLANRDVAAGMPVPGVATEESVRIR